MRFTSADVANYEAKLAQSKLRKAAAMPPKRPASDFDAPKSCQETPNSAKGLRLVICGQIIGGKNNIIITRSGRRFPKANWAAWRDDAVAGIREQLKPSFQTITEPVNVRLTYFAGDRRRRDMPAVIDAIWHVLEKSGVVKDDFLLWVKESTRNYDKTSPRAEIEFLD